VRGAVVLRVDEKKKGGGDLRKIDYPVKVGRDHDYETAVAVIELHDDCKDWIGQRVGLGKSGSGVTALVAQSDLPLKLFEKTSSMGYLAAGHILLKDIRGDWTGPEVKFKRKTVYGLDGKTYEKISVAATKGAGSFYCDTSVLIGPSKASEGEEET
jgi:hypothetical protein